MRKALLLIALAVCIMSCQEKKMDRFVREAKTYTEKHCPSKVDEFTTLDSLVFNKNDNGELFMYYTVNLNDEEKEAFYTVEEDIRNENLELVRNSLVFLDYKEAGVTFIYIYLDANTGKELLRLKYTKEDYR